MTWIKSSEQLTLSLQLFVENFCITRPFINVRQQMSAQKERLCLYATQTQYNKRLTTANIRAQLDVNVRGKVVANDYCCNRDILTSHRASVRELRINSTSIILEGK